MAAAVVVVRKETGQRPDASVPLAFHVLWDPEPVPPGTGANPVLIAMCSTQAEADAVAGVHLT